MMAREPDAIDAARVLALALLLGAGAAAAQHAGAPPVLLTLVQHLGFLAIPLVYCRLGGLPPLSSSGFARLSLRQVFLVLMAALGSLWVLKGFVDVQAKVFEWFGHPPRVDKISRVIDRAGLFGLPLLVVAPALCEEVLFRGVVFRGFKRTFGSAAALLITAALFAALHQWPEQTFLMLILGVYLGTLVWLTGSLWAGILGHAINNLAVLVSHALFGDGLNRLASPWWMVALSAPVLAMALALLALERPRQVTSRG